jgi:hypothetical protein
VVIPQGRLPTSFRRQWTRSWSHPTAGGERRWRAAWRAPCPPGHSSKSGEALIGGRVRGQRSRHHGAAAAGDASRALEAGEGVSHGRGQGWENGSRRSSGEEPEERTGGEPEEQSATVVEELGHHIWQLPFLAIVDEDARKSSWATLFPGLNLGWLLELVNFRSSTLCHGKS